MKLLRTVGRAILFSVLASLAFIFAWVIFSPPNAQREAMEKAQTFVYLYPVAVVGIISALVRYRLWGRRLFWALWLAIGAATVLAGLMIGTVSPDDVRSMLFVALLVAPVFTVAFWPLIMAVARVAKTLWAKKLISS
jgi:hypothetical protein